jgi:lysozyme
MIPRRSIASSALVWVLAACSAPPLDEAEQAAIVCGDGPTVKGIDVSYYQGAIDWAAARADGVEFAFIRASDGLGYIDSRFEQNWAGAKAQGILRGAYQFFRPSQDPIAQAELLLGKLDGSPGELPPVIDVENDGGLLPEEVEAAVRAWIGRVRPAIGREPIIYTGFYFWRDEVGAPDLTASPLWHAQYTTAECPNIAPPWTAWAFWQFTSMGRVAGIAGDVDVNRWNGTREALSSFTAERPCGILAPEGGEIDDGDACFTGGGPPQYLRPVADAGAGGDLIWTYTTASSDEVSFGHWELVLAEAGRYRVEVSTPAPYARSTRARYVVTAAGAEHELVLDQAASSGWQVLGELDFAAGGAQSIHLGDNTGEAAGDEIQLVFDAVRLTRIPPGEEPQEPQDPQEPDGDGGGCSAGGGLAGPGLGALGLAARRRRRRATPGPR